jgi:lysophospholipase L1-like esterase
MDETGTTMHPLAGGVNLTLVGATPGVAGKIDGTAVSFDGINDCAWTLFLNLTARTKVVVEFLAKYEVFNSLDGFAFEFGTPAYGAGRFIFNPNNSSPAGILLPATFGNVGYNAASYIRPTTNTWHHFAIVFDFAQTTEVALYIDGVLQGIQGTPNVSNNTGNFGNFNLFLSCRNGDSLFCKQIVQHFAIYSDITPAKIAEHANVTALTEHLVLSSELADTLYDGTGIPTQSTFSRFLFNTTSNTIKIKGTTDIYSSYPQWSQLALKVNNTNQTPLNFFANGQQEFVLDLGNLGTVKHVELINGTQGLCGGLTSKGTFIDSVSYQQGTALAVETPEVNSRILMYGDSILAGGNATIPALESVIPVLRATYFECVLAEAWGYRTLYDDAQDSAHITAFVEHIAISNPAVVYISIGINDYGLSIWNAADFGIAYAALVDAIHQTFHTAVIVCQSPIVASTEGANTFGDTLQDYRDVISALCATRTYTRYFNGATILALGDLADGVHPTSAGHTKYATAVFNYLDTYVLNAPEMHIIYSKQHLYNGTLAPPLRSVSYAYTDVAAAVSLEAGTMYCIKPTSDCRIWVYPRPGIKVVGDVGMLLSENEVHYMEPSANKTLEVVQVDTGGTLNVTKFAV